MTVTPTNARGTTREVRAPLARAQPLSSRPARSQQSARALGWFSIGLGLSELFLTDSLARAIGFRRSPLWLKVMGAREIATGIGILAAQRPGAGHLQWRVAGDAVDLALLASAWEPAGRDRDRLSIAAAAVLGVTVLDVLASRKLASDSAAREPLQLRASIGLEEKPDEVYRQLRDLSSLPNYLSHVRAIELQGEEYCQLTMEVPFGGTSRWRARIAEDVPGRRIAWETAPESPLHIRGSFELSEQPGHRGTLLRASLTLKPTAPSLVAPLARLLGSAPDLWLTRQLRRFRQFVETGEVATTQGQASGRRSLLSRHLP
jgi:uncharacterized membrane protein